MSLRRETEERVDWDKFGRTIVDKVLAGLEIWCSKRTRLGLTLAECYNENLQVSLINLAKGLHYREIGGITEEEINRLLKMPPDYYKKYERMLEEEIKRRICES